MLALAACGGDEAASPEQFSMQPGTWELRTWMELNGNSQGQDELVQTRELSRDAARRPVNQLLFGVFYPGKSAENIVAENGRISGSFDNPGTTPIPAHTSAVTGTYDEDSFRMVIELPVMTNGLTQVVEARLVDPLD